MSTVRTALRLSVVEALLASPTIAAQVEGRVFDSRLNEISSTETIPVMLVSTEQDEGSAWSANNGGPPFNETCDLVIEIAMRATEPDTGDPYIPETDREMEAAIDLLEQAAVSAVTLDDTPQSFLVRSAVTRRVTSFRSTRFGSDQTAGRFAVRVLTLKVELKSWQPDDPRQPPTGPFAVLPEPLRTVATALPAGSSGLATCQLVAHALQQIPITPFHGADITAAPRPEVDQMSPPTKGNPGRTFGIKADPDSL